MSTWSWEEYFWLGAEGFTVCLSGLVILAGILALRSNVKVAGSLLLAGGILMMICSGGSIYLNFRWMTVASADPDFFESLATWTRVTYSVGMLGALLEVVGLLLAVLALRAVSLRRTYLEVMGPRPSGPPPEFPGGAPE